MSYKGDNLMSVKRTNRSAALRALHEKGAMSRKRLAESMHLTPAAITKIVAEMISDGLLSEGESLPTGNAGRREILIDINAKKACGLGVLINLQQAILSATWLDGSVIFAEEIPMEANAPSEETAKRLSERLFALMEEHKIPREQVVGLGIAVRGITSADGRTVRSSFGALDETDYPLCALFEELTGFHCVMENNVRSLLAAQMFLSRDENEGSQFFLRCGYGIGGEGIHEDDIKTLVINRETAGGDRCLGACDRAGERRPCERRDRRRAADPCDCGRHPRGGHCRPLAGSLAAALACVSGAGHGGDERVRRAHRREQR